MEGTNTAQKKRPPTAMRKHRLYAPTESTTTKSATSKAITTVDTTSNPEEVLTMGKGEKKILSWDEEGIEEHDLLRGTRMKIDQPETPFIYYDYNEDQISILSPESFSQHIDGTMKDSSGNNLMEETGPKIKLVDEKMKADDKTICLETLGMKLEAVALSRNDNETSNLNFHHDKNVKEENFKKARAQHYNEMEMVRKFRAEHKDDDDDTDTDGES